jgi:hypothetical protein
MATTGPLVSILMPLYNHQEHVVGAIESVLRQTYANWELIICDDGSTDNSADVASRYRSDRIKLIRKNFNQGVSDALNSAAVLSKGELIVWLSSDDFFHPEKIRTHVRQHTTDPECQVTVAPYAVAAADASPLTEYRAAGYKEFDYVYSVARFLYGNYVNGLSVCYTRAALASSGLWCTKYPYVQDALKWISIFRLFKPTYIKGNLALSVSRRHTTSNSGARRGVMIDELRMLHSQIASHGPFAFAAGVDPLSARNSMSPRDLVALYISMRAILDEENLLGRHGLHSDVRKSITWWLRSHPEFGILEHLTRFVGECAKFDDAVGELSRDIRSGRCEEPRSSAELVLSHCRVALGDSAEPDLTRLRLKMLS